MEALFRIAPGADGLNSFCFDLNLDAAKLEDFSVDTWAINVDLGAAPMTGKMKHMGFVGSVFKQIGRDAYRLGW